MQKESFGQVWVDLAQLGLEPGLTPDSVIDRHINFVLEKLEIALKIILAPACHPTPCASSISKSVVKHVSACGKACGVYSVVLLQINWSVQN